MMIRNKTSTSMQKTYDECYLICSTAVYFEGQNNESEALRSWRSALDRIYYNNAYRMPPDWRPKNETEKALQESLQHMESQCKERVALLEALRDSRAEAEKSEKEGKSTEDTSKKKKKNNVSAAPSGSKNTQGWIGNGTVPAANYPDIPKPTSAPAPALPHRPAARPVPTETSSYRIDSGQRFDNSNPTIIPAEHKPLTPNPPPVLKQTSRTPSPDKKDTRNKLKTTLRPSGKDGKRSSSGSKPASRRPPAASKAAGLAWDSTTKQVVQTPAVSSNAASRPEASRQESYSKSDPQRLSEELLRQSGGPNPPTPPSHSSSFGQNRPGYAEPLTSLQRVNRSSNSIANSADESKQAPTPPLASASFGAASAMKNAIPYTKPEFPSYRSEYAPQPVSQASITAAVNRPKAYDAPATPASPRLDSPTTRSRQPPPPPAHRRLPADAATSRRPRPSRPPKVPSTDDSAEETTSSMDPTGLKGKAPRKKRPQAPQQASTEVTPDSSDAEPEGDPNSTDWEERLAYVKKNLPRGVDPAAAKQIFNEIVVQGDEVRWNDVAGLDAAKTALKEAVVYPFLRPDLFMGLREPARGMLLFGPPGTGKTMLARAVATESRSTFFAISASSLTSKWLGDSEKLVRALFNLAKALAPSIIFVDEIDSLLSSRGGSSEHESTRRIKTEFLIQWSDLQRAAAGKEQTEREKKEGDATRVLVLAATNMPWAIDEAARRRFVRRQYIPLPERQTRGEQLRTLLGHQKHNLNNDDIEVLVRLTDGYSGSDITALAKDAAMGPLRSLGEALLHMSMDEIRPIMFEDFESSLVTIRPSVSKAGLKEFEDWARDFGERGG